MRILIATAGRFAAFKLPAAQIAWLQAAFPAHEFVHATNAADIQAAIGGAEIVLATHLSAAAVEAAPSLRWAHCWAAGVNALLTPALVERPIVVTSSRGLNAESVAEHALALILAWCRQIPAAVRSQRERSWAQEPIAAAGYRLLSQSHVVVIGLGAIGAAAAHRLVAFGAQVTAIRRHPARGGVAGVARVAPPDDLPAHLGSADIVLLTAPGTTATDRLLDAGALARLPPHALVVNVSRGRLIDEAALLEALDAGRLGGAALDVFETEPLPADSPLWTHPRVLITPHVAGFLPGYWDAVAALFADNLRRFEQGLPLRNLVDKAAGY